MGCDGYNGELPVGGGILVTASTVEWSETKCRVLINTRVHTIIQD